MPSQKEEFFQKDLLERSAAISEIIRKEFLDDGDVSPKAFIELDASEFDEPVVLMIPLDALQQGAKSKDAAAEFLKEVANKVTTKEDGWVVPMAVHFAAESWFYPKTKEIMEGSQDSGEEIKNYIQSMEKKYGSERENWPKEHVGEMISIVSESRKRAVSRMVYIDRDTRELSEEDEIWDSEDGVRVGGRFSNFFEAAN